MSVMETTSGVSVGFVQAYDPDYENVIDFSVTSCGGSCGLTYSLVCPDGLPFTINAVTGELRVVS